MKKNKADTRRVEFGDWQTPQQLAAQVVESLAARGVTPATIIEPSCGVGSFLEAAKHQWPTAMLLGFEINPQYVAAASLSIPEARIVEANFFDIDWEMVARDAASPLLVLGNPPWVTNTGLGDLGADNLPIKTNFKKLAGLDAITGKANFDISEWMILRLLEVLRGKNFTLCLLCKTIVARRIIEKIAREGWMFQGSLHEINSMEHFGAAVDAAMFTITTSTTRANNQATLWPRYLSIFAERPHSSLGLIDGSLCHDVEAYQDTKHLGGKCSPEWRSGIKHDCASVMELQVRPDHYISQAGGAVVLEDSHVYPMMKGSDVANLRWPPTRAVLVTQHTLGERTAHLEIQAPKVWSYLLAHEAALTNRKSSIYRGQDRFAIFGVGDYTFAPWKVAIAGLYKRLCFMLVPPVEGKPVVFDDTVYFLSFHTEEEARAAHAALQSEEARRFFEARIFWEDMRPINKKTLQSLNLQTLSHKLGLTTPAQPGSQCTLFGDMSA